MLGLSRQLRYVFDPLTGMDLVAVGEGLAPANQAEAVYAIQNGILQLTPPDFTDTSGKYDDSCRQKGLAEPDEVAFKALPQYVLEGWGGQYWQQRAVSMAGVWDVLERARRADGRLCVGYQGVSAQLTHGLPYVAYGLDAGGYASYAVSPHTGIYSLGIYNYGRYARVQASWECLPLRPQVFDVVVITGVLGELAPALEEKLLTQAAHLLTPTGYLLITDVLPVAEFLPFLQKLGLKTQLVSIQENSLKQKLKFWLKQEFATPPILLAQWSSL